MGVLWQMPLTHWSMAPGSGLGRLSTVSQPFKPAGMNFLPVTRTLFSGPPIKSDPSVP